MATTFNFSHKRGDTFDGQIFQLSEYIAVANLTTLPAEGVTGEIYKTLDTGLFYKWVLTEYIVTTDKKYIDLTGAHLLCMFKTAVTAPAILTWTDGDGMTIVDGATGKFQFDEQKIDVKGAPYLYDVQITFSNGVVKTYVSGTMTVVEDVSRV